MLSPDMGVYIFSHYIDIVPEKPKLGFSFISCAIVYAISLLVWPSFGSLLSLSGMKLYLPCRLIILRLNGLFKLVFGITPTFTAYIAIIYVIGQRL